MGEQWIDAATAVSIVASGPADYAGMQSLCARAHSGLVKARARLIVSSSTGRAERRATNASVPQGFWWAGGHEALEQNWSSGDFSTWIDQKVHLQAYGVSFALGGVLEMVSQERRSAIARGLSVAGNRTWMPAAQATKWVKDSIGERDPKRFISENARLGFVGCRAIEAQRYEEGQVTELLWEEREWDIPPWFWEPSAWLPGNENWDLGQFGAEEPTSSGSYWMKVSGVHFLTESIEALLPPSATPVAVEAAHPEAPGKPKPGGRIAQAWWDDMWCDVWALIYQGDLKPTSQSEVEHAMMSWAVQNGNELGEATARVKARKLFKALNREATNFLNPSL